MKFKRFGQENGHLFQGRYKSFVVEPGAALGSVCHYIHLNPVRAGVVTAEQLSSYPGSSLGRACQSGSHGACLLASDGFWGSANAWLAQKLNMGSPFRLSRLASAGLPPTSKNAKMRKLCAKCKI